VKIVPVIQVENLVKFYGKFQALDGVDMAVEKGEVLGFIGPNGAGKTTTIRILLGLLRKNAGTADLFGKDAWLHAAELHKSMAYVPGEVNLWPTLTGGEVIDLLGKLRGGINHERRTEMLKRFELDPTKKCGTYSKGNRQKVALVSGLASDAELFLLDEPTSGLDPLMETVFQECILELKQMGKTVLLSSHTLSVVEKLCDRVSIIRQGKIVESGTIDELRHLTRTSISVETDKPIKGLEKIEGIHDLSVKETSARFQLESDKLHKALSHLAQYGFKSLVSRPPTLEELFMHHYGDSLEAADDGEKERAS
jgi:ABC-2 type transport system ATP-binding protein